MLSIAQLHPHKLHVKLEGKLGTFQLNCTREGCENNTTDTA